MASLPNSTVGLGSTLLIPFFLGWAVLADRAQVGVSTGGRGALPFEVIVVPLVAIVTVGRYGKTRSLGFLTNPAFLFAVLPYLALTALLPVLGVMFSGFPERTLLSITYATSPLSYLVLGAAVSSSQEREWSRWVLLAIVFQLAYAAGQAVYLSRGPGWELFAPFHGWDLSLQVLSGPLVQARSSGFYINPNELGLWAGIAVILGWTMLTPRLRGVGISLAVMTLLLSESRGAAVALAAAVVVGVALPVVRGRLATSSAFRAILTFVLASVLAVSAALMIASPGALLDRFGSLFQVLVQGPQADPNLAGRLDYWSAVVVLNSVYPWGTWGPPGILLGTSIDSSWFSALAQGSVPYVATLGLLMIAPMTVVNSRYRHPLQLVTVLVAVAGLTQTPFSYPAIAIFWVLLGAGLQSSVVAEIPAPPILYKPAGTGRIAAVQVQHPSAPPNLGVMEEPARADPRSRPSQR